MGGFTALFLRKIYMIGTAIIAPFALVMTQRPVVSDRYMVFLMVGDSFQLINKKIIKNSKKVNKQSLFMLPLSIIRAGCIANIRSIK